METDFSPLEVPLNNLKWVSWDSTPIQEVPNLAAYNRHLQPDFLQDVIAGRAMADPSMLAFRDPLHFLAGQLHKFRETWLSIASQTDCDTAKEVLGWIEDGVNVFKYFQHFRGSFKGENFDCDLPPCKIFQNHISCKPFSSFISRSILDRLATGAISLWGRVGEVSPPRIVMPLTVEPSKPRLCNDDRFINLWTIDKPFKLDLLPGLPRYVHKDSYQSVTDDKSGYDHILLTPNSRTFFGFQWGGWYFVSNTIPFGWKLSAYIYHTTGSLVSHHFRSIGIPCSLYIDDRHIGQLTIRPESKFDSSPVSLPKPDFLLAQSALFIVCYFLSALGYFIGLSKSILVPLQMVPYLGFISNSCLQAFTLIPAKREKFIALLRDILSRETVELVTLQKLAGKCISMALAVPGARLFTNEINMAISKASRSSRPVKLCTALRAEIEHWLFLDSWDGFLPWRSERHRHVQLCSDASSFAWGGVLGPGTISVVASDYWPDSHLHYDIATKEALALANVPESFASLISNSWVDVFVDNMALISAWDRQGSRSRPLFNALKRIFTQVLSSNVFISLHYIPSSCNPADFPSRRLSHLDASLSPAVWAKVQRVFGGETGHSVDLMALPSNVQCDFSGQPLPFFSPYPTPGCAGVNVFAQHPAPHSPSLFRNPYAFPPIALIPQLILFLRSLTLPCTLIIPDVYPRRFWWPLLRATATQCCLLAHKGDPEILSIPSAMFALGFMGL